MTTWPTNDAMLMMLAKYIGLELAYERLERAAIVADSGQAHVGKAARTVSADGYGEALRALDPAREPMPIRGYP